MLCSLLPWIYGLVSALLGGLIGWYLFKNRKWIPLQQVVNDQNEAYNTLSTTHNTLNARHASVQANLLDLQKAHSEWESRYHTLNNDHLTLSNAKRNLGIEYDNYKAEVANTEAALETHLTDMNALIKKREVDSDAQQAKLISGITTRDTKISQLGSQLAGFNANHDALQQKHDALQVSNDDYTSQITHLNHTIEDLTTDINFEKQRASALEASEKENQAAIQALENHTRDLTNQHTTLQVAHNDTNALVTALTTAHASEKHSWDAHKIALSNELLAQGALLKGNVKNAETQNALSALKDDKEKIDVHNQSLVAEKESWNAEKLNYEKQVEKLIIDIQDYHKTAEDKLKSKDDLNTSLNEKSEALKQQNEKLQPDSITLAKMVKEFETTKEHLNEVQNQFESAESSWQIEKMTYEEQLEELMEQIAENSENFEELRKNIKDLSSQLDEYKNDKQKLETTLVENVKSIEQLKTENVATTTHYTTLENEKTQWEMEKKEAVSQAEILIARLNNHLTKAGDYLTTSKTQIADGEKQIDLLKAQLAFSQTNFATQSEHIAELETYKQRYENLLAAQTSTNSLIEQLESERSKLSTDYNALNTLYISQSKEDGNWQSRFEALQTRSRNYEQLVNDLEAELARLRAGKTLTTEPASTNVSNTVKDNLEK